MEFAWIILLLAAMVHTRNTVKPKRAKKAKTTKDDSDTESETESIDWDELLVEATAPTASKGKAPAASSKAKTPPTAADKGKAPMEDTPLRTKRKSVARKRGSSRGISIEEPLASQPPPQDFISCERIKDFEKRECIGERHVNVKALKERSAVFGTIFDQAGLAPICNFPESSGYCPHSVRMFYQNGSKLIDQEDGQREFTTMVRSIKIKVTPQLIGEVLGMKAQAEGKHYLKGHSFCANSWRVVVDGICLPDTQSTGNSVYSRELRPEYRSLNFIVCYNILPTMQTKVLRWDRMLFLYLLGNPTAALGSNFDIPFLIWSRMAKYVEHAHPSERLPFPMIIMRILKKFKVDTSSSTYMYSLGTINETTVIKSLPLKSDDPPSPPLRRRPSTSAAAASVPTTPAARTAPSSTSDDDASVTSIYKEQQHLSSEQERMSHEFIEMKGKIQVVKNELQVLTASQITLTKTVSSMKKLMKKMLSKMGCSTSDDSDSQD